MNVVKCGECLKRHTDKCPVNKRRIFSTEGYCAAGKPRTTGLRKTIKPFREALIWKWTTIHTRLHLERS